MRPTHFASDGLMLMRIFSPVFTAYPQRFWPHCSMRTVPLCSSVAHTPSGVAGTETGAVATGAGVGVAVETAEGAEADGASNPTAGAGDVDAVAVEADGVLLVAATGGWGAAA